MTLPHFEHERELWDQSYIVIGADEVGRGAFAGPVAAGAVVFTPSIVQSYDQSGIEINDSKKLTVRKREIAYEWIRQNAITAVGYASVTDINNHGIVKATNKAYRRCIDIVRRNQNGNHFLLVDAFFVPYIPGVIKSRQRPITHGDMTSMSIAAASIVAKVERDRLMDDLSRRERYTVYHWNTNKGYGTKMHRTAISLHGTTPLHRIDFIHEKK